MPHPETLTCFGTGVSVILSRLPHNGTQASKHAVVWYLSWSVLYDLYFTVFFLSAFVGWYIEGRINTYSRKPCWPIFNILPWIDKIIWKILHARAHTHTHTLHVCVASPVTDPDMLERWHIPVVGKTLIVLNILNIPSPKNISFLPNTFVLLLIIHTAFWEFPILEVPESNLTIVLYSFISV